MLNCLIKLLKPFIFLATLAWSGHTFALVCTSAATGNWNVAATWAAGCGAAGPVAGDSVTILTGHTITTTANAAAASLTVNASGTLNSAFRITLTTTATIAGVINLTAAAARIRVTGATTVAGSLNLGVSAGNRFTGLVTLNPGAVWSATTATVNFRGGLTNNATTFTAGTGAYTATTVAQAFNGISPIVISTLTVTTIALTNNANLTVTTALGGTGSVVNAATGTLNIGGTSAITTLNATAVGNTVNYIGAAAQIAKPIAYHHLGLATSGVKTMAGITVIAGSLSISGSATMTGNAAFTVGGALNYASTGVSTLTAATPISISSYNQTAGTFAAGANTITVMGTGANTWLKSAGVFTSTGTVVFTGVAPQIGASNFNNFTINVGVGNTASLTGSVTLSGVLTLTSGRVSTGVNTLEISTSCIGITGSATSYVMGNLRFHYPTAAGTITCTFPIGDAVAYTPAVIAMTGVTSTLVNSTLTARTDTPDHADTTASLSGIVASKSVNRYWTLTPGVALTFGTYAATFNFVAGDVDAGALTANFNIRRKRLGAWSSPTAGAANPLNTTAAGMTMADGFGEFAIGETVLLSVAKSATLICDPVNGTTNPKYIPSALVRWTVIVTNSGVTSVNLSTITDLINFNTTPDANLITGAGGGVGCVSATGTPESAVGRGFKLNIAGDTRPGSYPKFFTTVADGDAAEFNAGTVTINYALGMPAEGAYLAGELKPGEVAIFYFNVTVN
ncbi:MAG: hypothetical protein ABL902_01655 [Gallionella sp.]